MTIHFCSLVYDSNGWINFVKRGSSHLVHSRHICKKIVIDFFFRVTFLLEKVKQSISWDSFQKSVFIVVELCYEFQRTEATCISALSCSLRYNNKWDCK